jgi:Skp family chaperone for outer membrane proteins
MRTPLSTPVALVFVAMIGFMSYQTRAMRRLTLNPAVLATVNLEQAFEGLQEKDQADAELTAMAEELKIQGDELADAIDVLQEEMDAYAVGSEQHQKTMGRWQLMTLEYQAFVEFSRRKIDIRRALTLKRLYQSIKQATQIMAEENGYDIVFVDDSIAEIPNGNETEVRRQISARRMLYTSPQIDITDELIARMNGGINAGG